MLDFNNKELLHKEIELEQKRKEGRKMFLEGEFTNLPVIIDSFEIVEAAGVQTVKIKFVVDDHKEEQGSVHFENYQQTKKMEWKTRALILACGLYEKQKITEDQIKELYHDGEILVDEVKYVFKDFKFDKLVGKKLLINTKISRGRNDFIYTNISFHKEIKKTEEIFVEKENTDFYSEAEAAKI